MVTTVTLTISAQLVEIVHQPEKEPLFLIKVLSIFMQEHVFISLSPTRSHSSLKVLFPDKNTKYWHLSSLTLFDRL